MNSLPPPQPPSAPGSENTSASRAARAQPTAWGSSQQPPSRRGLAPLSTNVSNPPAPSLRRATTSTSPGPQNQATSPLATTFSAVLTSANRLTSTRNPSSGSSASSPWGVIQTGSQASIFPQPGQSTTSSPRPRNTPSSTTPLASNSAPSQGGGGGGAGGSRIGGTFSPPLLGSVTSPGAVGSGSASSISAQSSLSKISVAQVSLLLDSISEKEGTAKWTSKAEQIRKLVDANGMEVFSKYFRRLVSGNASHIFPGSNAKSLEKAGNYPLLVEELRKLLNDPDQAAKIAGSVDGGDGDIFRDFDLLAFVEHFKLDVVSQCVLGFAFRRCVRVELQNKGDALLESISADAIHSISSPGESDKDITDSVLCKLIENLALDFPSSRDDLKSGLDWAVRQRSGVSEQELSSDLESSLKLLAISKDAHGLVRHLHRSAAVSKDAIESVLAKIETDDITEQDVASALLYMVFVSEPRRPDVLPMIQGLKNLFPTKGLESQRIVHGFDQGKYLVTTEEVRFLLQALKVLDRIDLDHFFGEQWTNIETQISFLRAFLSLSPEQLSVLQEAERPRTYHLDLFKDASEELEAAAREGLQSPYSIIPAVQGIFDLVLVQDDESKTLPDRDQIIGDLIQNHLAVFVVSTLAAKQPWTPHQVTFLFRCFRVCVLKQNPDYAFALEGCYRQSPNFVFQQFHQLFIYDPMMTENIFDICQELGWIEYMIGFMVPLSLDLACKLHQQSNLDIEQWVKERGEGQPPDSVAGTLRKFLVIKAEDETRVQRRDQAAPSSVPMAVKTVHALLLAMEDYVHDPTILTPIQQKCVATYPRLINYGEGFDDIIDQNTKNGNGMSEETDRQMQELLGKMYREELSFRQVLELMRGYKSSQDPAEQDLFTCIVHGLFDEYNCYHEYPPEALMKTAVMFGGIINFRLISGIPLKVGLGLILDAVRTSVAEQPMYKFGVEALEQLTSRLTEWAGVCSILVQIGSLRGTTVYQKAEEVLREQGHHFDAESDLNGVNGLPDALALANGNLDELLEPDLSTNNFRSLHVDPASGTFVEPEKPAQEAISFILNNLSVDTLEPKSKSLAEALQEEYYQWFAKQLVDQRAKTQPNYQDLYLQLVEKLEDRQLMGEVVRTTYASATKLLNAETTLNNSTEKAHLKNIGTWLGMLTIAKDRPVLHKNIYFRDLLVEAADTQRLVVAIPFTCKVLAQGAKSIIFHPPNPWLMDIIYVLIELYHFADLKLNLKFEIEVLCKEFQLDLKDLPPSTAVRERPSALDDELQPASVPDAVDAFEDGTLAAMNRGIRNERLSPGLIMQSLPQLESRIKYPPSQDPEAVRAIVSEAFTQAVEEIIAPVVERSITIASISSAQLIQKDFANEVSDEKILTAAKKMVKSLAGSLALVTCKEPLRMSISNLIRRPRPEVSEQGLSEGLTMMCVNDNLDMACTFVEQAAEERAMLEIERFLEPDLEERRRHKAARPNEPYVGRSLNRWSTFIPEPYRQGAHGLNDAQLEVYDGFGRQPRAGASHMPTNSADTNRQLPDVLQESFSTMPNLPTPAEQAAVPHAANQVDLHLAGLSGPHVNGFAETVSPEDKIQGLFEEVQTAARSSSVDAVKDLPADSATLASFQQLFQTLVNSSRVTGESLARTLADKICASLYSEVENKLEIEVMAIMLAKICQLSELVSRDVFRWMTHQEEAHISNVAVTAALVKAGLLDFGRIDAFLSRAMQTNREAALGLLSDLLDELLFCDEPVALRADFASSLDSMNQWSDEADFGVKIDINRKLKQIGVPPTMAPLSDDAQTKQDQLEYVFEEWVRLYQNPGGNDRLYTAFLRDMDQQQVMGNAEDSAAFVRFALDLCVAAYEHEVENANGSRSDAYLHIDSLARLVILLVKYQTGSSGYSQASFLQSILSVVVLVLNHHQVMRGERFNQRVFFRFFSSLLCEYSILGMKNEAGHKEMMLVVGEVVLSCQPAYFPAFTFAWMNLVAHRVFVSAMLDKPDPAFRGAYCQIIQAMIRYVGELLKPAQYSPVTHDLYKALLRVLLVLHHDFPEFIVENHFMLCNVVPIHCTQLRNLILSAYPSSFIELPDPFTPGLKVDRLDEMKKEPGMAGNFELVLEDVGLDVVIDAALRKGGNLDTAVSKIADAVNSPLPENIQSGIDLAPINVDLIVMNALVLYIGQEAIRASPGVFESGSPHFQLFSRLASVLEAESRYFLFMAIANQLRYPNSHTHYFCHVLLAIFGIERIDQQDSKIREQIVRVILERLIVNRPHPWGMLITLLELDRNTAYKFWDLPFIAASPEIKRLFQTLSSHVHQTRPTILG